MGSPLVWWHATGSAHLPLVQHLQSTGQLAYFRSNWLLTLALHHQLPSYSQKHHYCIWQIIVHERHRESLQSQVWALQLTRWSGWGHNLLWLPPRAVMQCTQNQRKVCCQQHTCICCQLSFNLSFIQWVAYLRFSQAIIRIDPKSKRPVRCHTKMPASL